MGKYRLERNTPIPQPRKNTQKTYHDNGKFPLTRKYPPRTRTGKIFSPRTTAYYLLYGISFSGNLRPGEINNEKSPHTRLTQRRTIENYSQRTQATKKRSYWEEQTTGCILERATQEIRSPGKLEYAPQKTTWWKLLRRAQNDQNN